MASGVARMVLADVLTDEMFSVEAERASLMKEGASFLLENHNDSCDEFAEGIQKSFKTIFSSVSAGSEGKALREQLWCQFHSIRLTTIPELWSALFESMDAPAKYKTDPLLMQYCTTKLFEAAVKSKYPTVTGDITEAPNLTVFEENALRYVAGFVTRSLLIKARKMPDSNPMKSDTVVCLQEMTHDEEGAYENYLSYTKVWLQKVNRGGLCHVSEVYLVFKAMELVTKRVLKSLIKPQGVNKKKALSMLITDEDVQFHWSLFAAKVPNDVANSVLEDC